MKLMVVVTMRCRYILPASAELQIAIPPKSLESLRIRWHRAAKVATEIFAEPRSSSSPLGRNYRHGVAMVARHRHRLGQARSREQKSHQRCDFCWGERLVSWPPGLQIAIPRNSLHVLKNCSLLPPKVCKRPWRTFGMLTSPGTCYLV